MQLGVASETLGYENHIGIHRDEVMRTLLDSVENIYITALHLSNLREFAAITSELISGTGIPSRERIREEAENEFNDWNAIRRGFDDHRNSRR